MPKCPYVPFVIFLTFIFPISAFFKSRACLFFSEKASPERSFYEENPFTFRKKRAGKIFAGG